MKTKALRLLPLMMMLSLSQIMARPIDLQTAREVGTRFMNANTRTPLRGAEDLQLVTTYSITRGDAAFYVFNTPNGFVIVSADDCATPILGYSDEGLPFDPDNVPIQLQDYLQGFVEQIQYGIENHVQDEITTQQWELMRSTGILNNNCEDKSLEDKMLELLKAKNYSTIEKGKEPKVTLPTFPKNRSNRSVEPLITAQWDQGCYYNTMCPEDENGTCNHVPTGCVATSMGMIMRYWGYPAQGIGSHSYTPDGYPEQTVNFGETTYDWDNMPDQLDENSTQAQIDAVSTLLWHCGVAVQMAYSATSSGALDEYIPNAFHDYFGYNGFGYCNDAIYRFKEDNTTWLTEVKACLDLERPLLYFATDTGEMGGHAFVCDGYNAEDQLHFNWGWGGNGNGYYAVDALDVEGYQFNDNVHALFGILPPSEFQLRYNIIEGGVEVTYEQPELGSSSYFTYPDTIVIPSQVTIDGTTYPVIAIGDNALQCCFSLRKVVIPNSVKSIGEYAFYSSGQLPSMEVVMSDSVTIIKRCAFTGAGIQSIDLPNTLLTIEPEAFSFTQITSLTIPRSLTTIGHSFSAISSIDTINWNADSCGMIHEGFFWWLGISKLNIGEHVRYLPEMVFAGSEFPSVTLPESLIYIGSNCFNRCQNITSITIPSNVSTIEHDAFEGCIRLSEVYMQPLVAPFINGFAFANNAEGRIFHVPCGTWDAYYNELGWCTPGQLIREPGEVDLSLIVFSHDTIMGNAEIVRYPSACDSTVMVAAHADYGYHFDHWSNGIIDNPFTFKLINDTSLIAYFTKNQYSVTGVGARSIFCMDFEEPLQDTVWTLKNEDYINRWYIDNLDSTNRFLYISNDNGVSNSYINENAHSYVFTYHPMYLETGDYLYSFDWRVDGFGIDGQSRRNEEANDCMFAFISPQNIDSIPLMFYNNNPDLCLGYSIIDYLYIDAGCAYFDEFYGQHEWQNNSVCLHVPVNGLYNLGFYWRNGDIVYGPEFYVEHYIPNGHPAAVDNVLLGALDTIRGYVIGAENVDYLDTATITAIPNPGYRFVCWYDCDTNITKDVVVTGDLNCVAYFEPDDTQATQTANLAQGWNWWAPMVQAPMADIEDALGNNLEAIKASGETLGDNTVLGEMYRIQTAAPCNLTLNGLRPALVAVNIAQGHNWFGYTGMQPLAIENLSITPSEGDKVVSQNEGFAVFNGTAWEGTLTTLQPGHGYVYFSTANGTKTIVFE